jgi:hypothetical protein
MVKTRSEAWSMRTSAAALSSSRSPGQVAGGQVDSAPSLRSGPSVFLYSSTRNQRDNINTTELDDLKNIAKQLLRYTEDQIAEALKAAKLKVVRYANQEEERGR